MKPVCSCCTSLLVLLQAQSLLSQSLTLPQRPANALAGGEFVRSISTLGFQEREAQLVSQITQGNVPDFLRKLCPVKTSSVSQGRTNTATFFVTPDYLAVGSDDDYFLVPMSPMAAGRIASILGCVLPTRKMVDAIYTSAEVKLAPAPIPPSAAMTTVTVFDQHNMIVREQRGKDAHPLGALVAGHKKDVVLSSRLAGAPGKVAIYGWHQTNGVPIQPLYLGHTNTWVDYSHGVRLVQSSVIVNGVSNTIAKVLDDQELSGLLSDEGSTTGTTHPTAAGTNRVCRECLPGFEEIWPLGLEAGVQEQIVSFTMEPGVKIQINAPGPKAFAPNKPVQLTFYGLPNGNTTDQTIGRKLQPGDDWHFDIQHIGAQTRFLREQIGLTNLVVAYLENDLKSWPAWRKKHDLDSRHIHGVVEAVKSRFSGRPVKLILSGHSGGGSFIFGYLNSMERIPDDVERITFLDSNYAYDPALGHLDKLVQWLKGSEQRRLSVLAYDDAVALLNGKPFVSAAGGTWGRSHLMLKGLAEHFSFREENSDGLKKLSALGGRVQFLLKENPDRVIFHTVQVERNGFIHCLVSGTLDEGRGYVYFGSRAYLKWIAVE